MRVLIFTVLLLLSFAVSAQSEDYDFSRLDIYSGLSHNQVNAILKDQDGFLWFGTTSGLNRYDGYSFKIFRKQPNDSSSLTDSHINALYELPDGKIWVVTRAAACIYNSHTEKFIGYESYLRALGLPSGYVVNIVKGSSGRYWFLYDNALYLYSSTDKKVKAFTGNLLNASERITSIKETNDGKLWMVYQNGFLQK